MDFSFPQHVQFAPFPFPQFIMFAHFEDQQYALCCDYVLIESLVVWKMYCFAFHKWCYSVKLVEFLLTAQKAPGSISNNSTCGEIEIIIGMKYWVNMRIQTTPVARQTGSVLKYLPVVVCEWFGLPILYPPW